jgi:hypothetical protein
MVEIIEQITGDAARAIDADPFLKGQAAKAGETIVPAAEPVTETIGAVAVDALAPATEPSNG